MFERTWTVRFTDTDATGVAHYPRVVDVIHETSDVFMESIDNPFWDLATEHDVELLIVEVDVEFHEPMNAGDEVTIRLTTDVDASSVRFDYEGVIDGTPAFTAFEQRECVPVDGDRPIDLPEDLSAALTSGSA